MRIYTMTINILYIYPMQILRKHQLDIRRSYLYLTALIFSFVLILQVSNANGVSSIYGVFRYTVFFLANYFTWVFLVNYIYGAVEPIHLKGGNQLKTFSESIISLVLLLLFHLVITNVIYYAYLMAMHNVTFNDVLNDFKPFWLKSILSRVLDLGIIIVFMKSMQAYWVIQKQKLKVVTLENELHLSQLEALRAQLDPHFLFNTLHTLNSLIGYDDEKARSMIMKVTHLLRKMLDQKGKHMITFEEELDYFRSYLEIEQERFHDRLNVELEIDEETKTVLVPALILQPLIENAFKHGISLIEGNGEIKLSAAIQNNRLAISLSNTIPERPVLSIVHSTKIGLSNMKNRLSQTFGEDYEFSTEKQKGVFVVTLKIKLP